MVMYTDYFSSEFVASAITIDIFFVFLGWGRGFMRSNLRVGLVNSLTLVRKYLE